MLHTNMPDECCTGPLSEDLRTGKLDEVQRWWCPKCGQEWRCELHRLDAGSVEARHWVPFSPILIFKP